MDEQSQNAYDQLADQNQFRMSHHVYHLLPGKGGNKKKFSLLPKEGPRLPSMAALGCIIAYYVGFGKIRGTESPLRLRRCPPFDKGG